MKLDCGVVGAGRMGTALVQALRARGVAVDGPARRGSVPRADVIVLCVPDAEIGAAAAAVAGRAQFVGHTSGAAPLRAALPAGAELFALHPLQTLPSPHGRGTDRDTTHGDTADRDTAEGVARDTPSNPFAGAGCAIAGSTRAALTVARSLAEVLEMTSFEISDAQRPAYHAAASIASNYLVTLEAMAERVAAGAGLDAVQARTLLAPIVQRTVENWARLGPAHALTGPLTRGDEATVATQRAAVAATAAHLLPLFDALTDATRELAGTGQLLPEEGR